MPQWDGRFSIVVAGAPTAVADEAALPAEFALLPNFPHPFNARTTIGYQLPRAAPVRLTLFNGLGQEIRQIIHAVQPAGVYQVVWDGRDEDVDSVANGTYFYRIELSTGRQAFGKVVVLD